ncbi:MAG: hypothetical protein JXQ73_17860 [Phycisphaerae bacterium]|nr:hypothetical protein [Phycisphaerae bacterium]
MWFRVAGRWLRRSVVIGLVGLTGCAGGSQYRVKTSQPWPDEWISGVRAPYERIVQLTGKTVAWHRKANWQGIEVQIVQMLRRRPDLYGFVRTGVGQSLEGLDQSTGLRYLEVKVGPCFFDFATQPPKVTIDYKNKPFKEAMADLMGRVQRSYLLSPAVADRPPITAHLINLDWREAAVRLLLDADVFVEPVWYNPISLRSFEYEDQNELMSAVRSVMDGMRNPTPEAPLTIVPWEQWVLNNRAYQLRYDASLRARPTTQQLGPPPGTAILSSDLAIAKKQVLYGLPHQLHRPEVRPSTQPSNR